MRLHARRSDWGAALEVYERLVENLHAQLGESPSDETIALAQQIRPGGELAASAALLRPLPLWLCQPPLMVGREQQLLETQHCLETGGVALLTAQAGMGKSRLFNEALRAWPGVGLLRIELSADDRLSNYGLIRKLITAVLARSGVTIAAEDRDWLQWLARPQPGGPPALNLSPERQVAMLAGLIGSACANGLVLIGIEDLHFADETSLLLLLRLLAPRAEHHGLKWLLTCRDGDDTPASLRQWLLACSGPIDPVVLLPPWTAHDLKDLLLAAQQHHLVSSEWVEALHRHCGGHPLNSLQVLRELHERAQLQPPGADADLQAPRALPVPRDVMRRVARRLDMESPQTQQLAFLAAVYAGGFSARVAQRLLQCTALDLLVPWRRLEGLLILQGNAFVHELVRQAVLDAIPNALLPELHALVAVVMEQEGGEPERLATHWAAAGKPAAAAVALRGAADAALATGQQAHALACLQRAEACFLDAGDRAGAFQCGLRVGKLQVACGSADAALQVALGLQQRAAGPAEHSATLNLLARIRTERHEGLEALQAAQHAVTLAAQASDPALMSSARLREAAALYLLGRHPEALAILEALRTGGAEFEPNERFDLDDHLMAVLGGLGQRDRCLAISQLALAEAERADDLVRAAEQAGYSAVQLGYLCRSEEAYAMGHRSIALSRRAGNSEGYMLIDRATLAGSCVDSGRFAEAMALFESVVPALGEAGFLAWQLNAQNLQAMLFMQLGRPYLAARLLADPPEVAPKWARALRFAAQARLAHELGRPVWPALTQAQDIIERPGAMHNEAVRWRVELELARFESQHDRAITRAQGCGAWAAENGQTGLNREARMVQIQRHLGAGQSAPAAALADKLVDDCAPDWQVYRFSRSELWWTLCNAWLASGQTRRAAELARFASSWMLEREVDAVPEAFRRSWRQANRFNRALSAPSLSG